MVLKPSRYTLRKASWSHVKFGSKEEAVGWEKKKKDIQIEVLVWKMCDESNDVSKDT